MSENWDESSSSDGMAGQAGSGARMADMMSSGADGAVPVTARPAASKVRNSSKDVSRADGGWEGSIQVLMLYVLMFTLARARLR
jgi:hypothetical protein